MKKETKCKHCGKPAWAHVRNPERNCKVNGKDKFEPINKV